MDLNEFFRQFAKSATDRVASPWSFIVFLLVFAIGLSTGSLFHDSETWHFWAHISVATITFFLALLIQNAENRNSKAIQLKLDEIIRVLDGAHNALAGSEDLPEEQLEKHAETLKNNLEQVETEIEERK